MAVTKLSNLSVTSGRSYSSLLAGNPTYVASSYESIATATGTGSSGTITFSSIPSGFKHLQIRGIARTSAAYTTPSQIKLRFNSDSGANYTRHTLSGNGTTASAAGAISLTEASINNAVGGDGQAANLVGVSIIDILDYGSTSKYKTIRTLAGEDDNGVAGSAITITSNLWLSTSAVTSISLDTQSGNWTTQTTFALYGIKEA